MKQLFKLSLASVLVAGSMAVQAGTLADALPMKLVSDMPAIHFKPAEVKRKAPKGMYTCPVYLYPIRTGSRERPSFMVAVNLKAGDYDANFWIKRGTAMLLSTAD